MLEIGGAIALGTNPVGWIIGGFAILGAIGVFD